LAYQRAQDLLPRGQLQPVGETEQPRRIRERQTRLTCAVRAAIHSPATALSTPDQHAREAGVAARRERAPSSGRTAESAYIGMRGKRAGSVSPAPPQLRTSSTIASTSRCSISRSTA
jgi:hypothetical protein